MFDNLINATLLALIAAVGVAAGSALKDALGGATPVQAAAASPTRLVQLPLVEVTARRPASTETVQLAKAH